MKLAKGFPPFSMAITTVPTGIDARKASKLACSANSMCLPAPRVSPWIVTHDHEIIHVAEWLLLV
jgi:hypothetical protein